MKRYLKLPTRHFNIIILYNKNKNFIKPIFEIFKVWYFFITHSILHLNVNKTKKIV